MLAAIRGVASLRLLCNKCPPQPSRGAMPYNTRTLPLLASCLAVILAGPPATAACHVDKVTTVPLTIAGSRLLVPVSMNETAGQFMVDTGAASTLLAGPFASRAHVRMDALAGQSVFHGSHNITLPVNQAHVRMTQFGTMPFQDWEYAVIPPEAGNASLTKYDGILGMDFMHYFDLDIDLRGGTFTLWRVSGCTDIHPVWQGDYDAIPLKHTADQAVTIPAFVDNAELDMEFDTGAGGVWLMLQAAKKAGVTDAMLAHDPPVETGDIGGRLHTVRHQFGVFLLGNGEFDKPTILVDTAPSIFHNEDGFVDWRFLKANKIWFSYGTNTLFVQTGAKQK
jgi:predicted aspartyl protease